MHGIETVGPVDTQQSHHGQEDTYAEPGRTLHVEGIELLHAGPGIAALSESQGIDVGAGTQHERIAELQGEAVVGIATGPLRRERTVVITTQSDGLSTVIVTVARGAVTSHIEGFEG